MPKLSGLKQHSYYLTISVGQESGSRLAGCSWFRVSYEVLVKMLVRATVIWRPIWTGEFASLTELMAKGLSFSLAVGQKPQFLSVRASLLGCSQQGSWLPERKRHNNQDRHCSLCYDLNSEVTYYHINPMLNVEGDYTRWKYQEVELPGGSFGGWHHSC